MNHAQCRSMMKAFIYSQLGYFPLVWMLYSKKINIRIKSLHECVLRVVYKDYDVIFSELLCKNKSVTIHQRNLQLLATEIFKTKNKLNPEIVEEIFTFENVDYNLRNNLSLKVDNLKTVYHGTEFLTNIGAKIWDLLQNDLKKLKPLPTFKSKNSDWATDEYLCRTC